MCGEYDIIPAMAKNVFVISALLVLICGTVLAGSRSVSLGATGYDWLGYDKTEKAAFAELLYVVHDVDRDTNRPEGLIARLDEFYYGAIRDAKADPLRVDEDEFLKIRCADVITKHIKRETQAAAAQKI